MRVSLPIRRRTRLPRGWRTAPAGALRGASQPLRLWLAALLICLGSAPGRAQFTPLQTPVPTPTPQPHGFFLFRLPQRPLAQIIPPQEGPNISARLLDRATPDNTHVVVSISKQRIYLMIEDEVVIDSPISSGRKGHPTPTGTFHIRGKELSHFSDIYGNFVDRDERVVRSGVSALIDSAPSGSHFEGAPMRFFMRLTDEGVGMHVGILPGYPASHGCVRLPADIAPLIYSRVRVGTPVLVRD